MLSGRNSFISALLSRLCFVNKYFKSDRDAIKVAPLLPTIVVKSATIFHDYRDLVVAYVYRICEALQKKVCITCKCEGSIKCNLHIDQNYGCAHVGYSAAYFARKYDTYIGIDLASSTMSAKMFGADVVICCGDNKYVDHNSLCVSCDDKKDHNASVCVCNAGIRCRNFSNTFRRRADVVYEVQTNLSIIVIDADIAFGNGSKYPFGPLVSDIDKLAFGTDVAVIVGTNERNNSYIEETILSINQSIKIVYASFSVNINNSDIKYLFFSRSDVFKDIKSVMHSQGVKLIDCVSFASKHRYRPKEIHKLLSELKGGHAKLLTTYCDYSDIVFGLQSIVANDANDKSGRQVRVDKSKASDTQFVADLLESFKRQTEIIDIELNKNQELHDIVDSAVMNITI